jgi:hypothetical protein
MGGDVSTVKDAAQAAAGYGGSVGARADSRAILWSRSKLEELGCFTEDWMAKMREGGAPVITKGPEAGTTVALDHVLPRSIVPELAARFYNLEIIPSRKNLAKSNRIGQRELDLARRWKREGLISAAGLAACEAAAK